MEFNFEGWTYEDLNQLEEVAWKKLMEMEVIWNILSKELAKRWDAKVDNSGSEEDDFKTDGVDIKDLRLALERRSNEKK